MRSCQHTKSYSPFRLQHVGSYKDYRRRAAKVEKEVGWANKVPKLFWRGSMRVGTADRESMKQMADGHSWNDVQEVVWAGETVCLAEGH